MAALGQRLRDAPEAFGPVRRTRAHAAALSRLASSALPARDTGGAAEHAGDEGAGVDQRVEVDAGLDAQAVAA